tara:strand:- start:270 stop:686 length:417 start_codon:yes stop_codon:yes gene_type:complete
MPINYDHTPAELFEMKRDNKGNIYPSRVNPIKRGIIGKYILSLIEGVVCRFGGQLELWNEDNSESATIGMRERRLVLSVCGKDIFSIESGVVRVPSLQVGEPGASWIEMYRGHEKVYVWVTPKGRLSVRKTKPPALKE